ncbi:MAG: CoA ester lyase [Woeseiaceae bacterium]|nr:CoA ester lyase [Woeseiaceae bacterium]
MHRSYLFVPGDSERKLGKARDSGADALIVDLEDSVAPGERDKAREIARTFLAEGAPMPVWVRMNPLATDDAMLDLRAVMPEAPAGIMLPKCLGGDDVAELGRLLGALEVEHEITAGQTAILPLVTERPAALFRVHEYADCDVRLAGLTWGAEDLSAALGASASRDDDGRWLPPYELARSLCLVGAAAAGVVAIDTVFTNFRDADGLAACAARSRRDGFRGMLAIHPAQVGPINDAFTPSAAEIERAERIVARFAGDPGAGTLSLDGEMIDRPHLEQARRILQLAGRD